MGKKTHCLCSWHIVHILMIFSSAAGFVQGAFSGRGAFLFYPLFVRIPTPCRPLISTRIGQPASQPASQTVCSTRVKKKPPPFPSGHPRYMSLEETQTTQHTSHLFFIPFFPFFPFSIKFPLHHASSIPIPTADPLQSLFEFNCTPVSPLFLSHIHTCTHDVFPPTGTASPRFIHWRCIERTSSMTTELPLMTCLFERTGRS